jgi:hypothetical protein
MKDASMGMSGGPFMLIPANGSKAGAASALLGGREPGEDPGPRPLGRGLPEEGRGLPSAMLLEERRSEAKEQTRLEVNVAGSGR